MIAFTLSSLHVTFRFLLAFAILQKGGGDPPPSSNVGPDGNTYTNACTSYNTSGTEIQMWFNDEDGDCYSEDWIADFLYLDGTHEIKDSWGWGVPDAYDTLNFNYWSCCDEIILELVTCTFEVVGGTIYVTCGNIN